jgi:predicted dehydrogenase
MSREGTRRAFLHQASGAAGLAAAGLALSSDSEQSIAAASKKSEKIRIALMGLNDRGFILARRLVELPEVEIAYVCDPDSATVPKVLELIAEHDRQVPVVLKDFRTALDDRSVHALMCAAPDHWHALATILACEAGKDVYVEKPVSHRLAEGRLMVEAARRFGRVVQTGTQRRSAADFQSAVALARSGRLGRIYMAHAQQTKQRPDIGKQSVVSPPPGLDFDLWCGPAPNRGYKQNLVHYHWHWRWDYGSGDCGNLGVHLLDVVRWVMDLGVPHTVCSGGGLYACSDDKETPDTQTAVFDFEGATVVWDHKMWGPDPSEPWITFYGTKGRLECGEFGWRLFDGPNVVDSCEPWTYRLAEFAHLRDFLQCIATRERPNADIEEGHLSAAMAHLANIAYRTRSTIRFDERTETIPDHAAANALLTGSYREAFGASRVFSRNRT